MLDRAVLIYVFYFRVGNTAVIFEKWREATTGDIAAFVDRRRQNCAAELAEPDRVVRAPAEEGDAEWRTSDDHAFVFLFTVGLYPLFVDHDAVVARRRSRSFASRAFARCRERIPAAARGGAMIDGMNCRASFCQMF